MGPSPTDGPSRHPGSERYQWNLHSDLAASHNPPLSQRKERDGLPSRLFPDLLREQYLPTQLLLSGPPPRAHPGHPVPGRAYRTIASSDPSISCRTRERNVLAVACFALPFFVVFLSSASPPPSLSSSLLSLSSSPLVSSPSFSHSVMKQAKIFRISPPSNSPLRIAASVSNGRRRTVLRGV